VRKKFVEKESGSMGKPDEQNDIEGVVLWTGWDWEKKQNIVGV